MTESTPEFTDREKDLIVSCVKVRRFDSDEMYDLYEKVTDWRYGDE